LSICVRFINNSAPISFARRVVARSLSITASTPVQLFYGTSTAGNLSVINKDYMTGSSVNFTGLATIYFS
jgi:hypothetical protein